jgi:hypothetical protein
MILYFKNIKMLLKILYNIKMVNNLIIIIIIMLIEIEIKKNQL